MATGLLYQRNDIEIEIKKENWCEDAEKIVGQNLVLSKKLSETIMKSEAAICLEGHWVPVPKEDTIRDLLEEVAE